MAAGAATARSRIGSVAGPLALAGLAAWIGPRTPLGATGTAIFAGLLIARFARVPDEVRTTARVALWIGIALLGSQIDWDIGLGRVAGLALAAAATGIAATWWFGRRLGLSPGAARALGVGTGICGASAIAATRRVTGATDDEAAAAAATVTLLGTVGMVAWPLLALTPLPATFLGAWAGASVHAVPHAVGAGAAVGAAGLAALVKMSRVALLPVVALAGSVRGGRFWIPSELVAFAGVAVVTVWSSPEAIRWLGAADRWALLIGFAALALGTRWPARAGWLLAAGALGWGVLLAVTGILAWQLGL